MKETGHVGHTRLIWVLAHPPKDCIILCKSLIFPECKSSVLNRWDNLVTPRGGSTTTTPFVDTILSVFVHPHPSLSSGNAPMDGFCLFVVVLCERPCFMRKTSGHLICVLIDSSIAGQSSALLPFVSHTLPTGTPSDSNAARLSYASLGPSSSSCVPGWLLLLCGSAQHHFLKETFPATLPLTRSLPWKLASQPVIGLCAVPLLVPVCLPQYIVSSVRTKVLSIYRTNVLNIHYCWPWS